MQMIVHQCYLVSTQHLVSTQQVTMFQFTVILVCGISALCLAEPAKREEEVRQARGSSQCGGTFYYNRGVVTSPYYPYDYDNSMDCTYRVIPQISGSYTMRLYVCDMDVESSVFGGCADSVKFGNSGQVCGKKTGSYYSYSFSGGFPIRFQSDWKTTRRGFRIAFCADCYDNNAVKALCNGNSGTTTSSYRTTSGRTSGYTHY